MNVSRAHRVISISLVLSYILYKYRATTHPTDITRSPYHYISLVTSLPLRINTEPQRTPTYIITDTLRHLYSPRTSLRCTQVQNYNATTCTYHTGTQNKTGNVLNKQLVYDQCFNSTSVRLVEDLKVLVLGQMFVFKFV
jgi:hypothetical protein